MVWFNAPPGVPKPLGVEPQDALAVLARPELFPWISLEQRGVDRIPARGGTLLVAERRSNLDPLLLGFVAAQIDRRVRFAASPDLTDTPIVGPLVTALGALGADLAQASAALSAGELVATFASADAARLALDTGIAPIPVSLAGSDRAWPPGNRFPYVLNLADPPTVTTTVGSPIRLSGSDHAGAATEIADALAALASRG